MRKLLRLVLGIIACGVLLYSGYQIYDYISQANASASLTQGLAKDAVVIREPDGGSEDIRSSIPTGEEPGEPEETMPPETAPIEVDFEVLQESCADVVAWIYSPDTPINLPIAQSDDNNYYLRRLLDGTWNHSGTLFEDFRCAPDFSDANTIVYGHNMKNDSMFGTLPQYKSQEYYEAHPVMWLLTPDCTYRVDLVAGYVTSTASPIYQFNGTEEETFRLIQQAAAQSLFQSDVEIAQGDCFLTLSTCSYEYDDARFVLIGKLTPLD